MLTTGNRRGWSPSESGSIVSLLPGRGRGELCRLRGDGGGVDPRHRVRLRPFERLRLEERLGERVEAVPVLCEQLNRLVVRGADDAPHLVVDALPRPLGDLRVPREPRAVAFL